MSTSARGKSLYHYSDLKTGSAGGAMALTADGAGFRRITARPSFGQKVETLRSRAGDFELVVDLGQRIGSPEWFRGFATCFALCYAAWSLTPSIGAIPGASPAPLPDAQFEEAQALTISPLALGGDTGRRMAPTEAVMPLPETPERPIIDLRTTLGRGDGLARVLERAGVGGAEASQVASMIGDVVSADDIRPGTIMDLTLGRRPNRTVARPLDGLSFRARFDLRSRCAASTAASRSTPFRSPSTRRRSASRAGSA